jgi:hypothetical protein
MEIQFCQILIGPERRIDPHMDTVSTLSEPHFKCQHTHYSGLEARFQPA